MLSTPTQSGLIWVVISQGNLHHPRPAHNNINQTQHNTIRSVGFISGITDNLYSHNVGVVGGPQYYWEGECYIKCQEIVDGGIQSSPKNSKCSINLLYV